MAKIHDSRGNGRNIFDGSYFQFKRSAVSPKAMKGKQFPKN